MDRIHTDLSKLDDIERDIQLFTGRTYRTLAKPLPPMTQPLPITQLQRDMWITAADLAGRFDPTAQRLGEVLVVGKSPPPVTRIPPAHTKVGRRPISGILATLGLGYSGAAYAGFGATLGGGVYGSTTREVGVYGSAGIGGWTNIGVSAGGTFTHIFGPPSDFGGPCWGVGCDVGGKVVAGGAILLFSLVGPLRVLGYAVTCGVGASFLPVNMTVQLSLTKTKPLLYFP